MYVLGAILLVYFFCFIVDPDPAFYLKGDPDAGSQTNAHPDPRLTFPSLNVEFLLEKYTKI
jgi:hypothetical protein